MAGEPGDYRVICDRSGFKVWASETVIEAKTGARVLARFADKQNPADFPVHIRETNNVTNARTEQPDVFLTPGQITPADL